MRVDVRAWSPVVGRLIGPVAQQALRTSRRPIMLRTPGANADAPYTIRRILVPVDFRHDLIQPTLIAHPLARYFNAEVTLLHVSEPRSSLQSRLLPAASAAMRRQQRQHVVPRLAELAANWSQMGIAVTTVVEEGAADATILEQARLGEPTW